MNDEEEFQLLLRIHHAEARLHEAQLLMQTHPKKGMHAALKALRQISRLTQHLSRIRSSP
jgi:ribosomal protein S20